MNGKILTAILLTQGLSNGIWLQLPPMIAIFGIGCAIGLLVCIVDQWDR